MILPTAVRKFVEMGNIRPDTYAAGTNVANKDSGDFINLDNIQEAKKVVEREIEAPEFVEMGQILTSGSKKIDVNNSSASEISILPGINIVMAKKLSNTAKLTVFLNPKKILFMPQMLKNILFQKLNQ